VSDLEELEEMSRDCQEKLQLIKDIFEEFEINLNRFRVIIQTKSKE